MLTVVKGAKKNSVPSKVIPRAPSAYNLFVKENFQQVSTQMAADGLKPSVVTCSPLLRAKWTALSQVEKENYESRAAAAKEEVERQR